MSAGSSARSVRQADGLDPVRALQRVLYRSAKQDRTRRFHALFDKLTRSDVMWRAWVDVATNQGAPGVDGVTHRRCRVRGCRVGAGLSRWSRRAASVGYVQAEAVAAGAHTQAGQAGRDPPARHSRPGRPGDHDSGEDRARADLRSRFSPGEFRVPPEAVGPTGPRGRPSGGQPGSGVGARR